MKVNVAFKFTRNRKKGLFRKDSPTKAEREQVIFENYFTGVCKIFIMINSLSLSKFYKHQ